MTFSSEIHAFLCSRVRESIHFYFEHGRVPIRSDFSEPVDESLLEHRACFVTLYSPGHQLRGCIGCLQPKQPLIDEIMEQAGHAAFQDFRFSPLKDHELGDLTISISILSVPVPIADYNDIVLGQHGMILHKNGRSAVFLPKVATEQGWDLSTTLTHLSQKAGLSPTDWQTGCQYEIFESEDCSESTDDV